MKLLPFTFPADMETAHALARAQGYGESTAYCSTSDVPGLYCLPTHKGQAQKVIVKTAEWGFVVMEFQND